MGSLKFRLLILLLSPGCARRRFRSSCLFWDLTAALFLSLCLLRRATSARRVILILSAASYFLGRHFFWVLFAQMSLESCHYFTAGHLVVFLSLPCHFHTAARPSSGDGQSFSSAPILTLGPFIHLAAASFLSIRIFFFGSPTGITSASFMWTSRSWAI